MLLEFIIAVLSYKKNNKKIAKRKYPFLQLAASGIMVLKHSAWADGRQTD